MVDVIAERSVVVTGKAQTLCWGGYGLKLHIQFSCIERVDAKPVSDHVYYASLYYLKRGMNQIEIHFVITKDEHATVSPEPLFSLPIVVIW